MLRRFLLAGAAVVACALGAGAQTIYEPVRYQYGGQNVYYYGGSDPAVFARAEFFSRFPSIGRVNGAAFSSSSRTVRSERVRVYSDAFPYADATQYGYSVADAHNDAYAAVPRYFRMAELRGAGVVQADGTRVVGPVAGAGGVNAASPAVQAKKSAAPAPRAIIRISPGRQREEAGKLPQANSN